MSYLEMNTLPEHEYGLPCRLSIRHGTTWIAQGFGLFRAQLIAWIGTYILVIMSILGLQEFLSYLMSLVTEPKAGIVLGALLGSVGWGIFSILIGGLMFAAHKQQQSGKFETANVLAGSFLHPIRLALVGVSGVTVYMIIGLTLINIAFSMPDLADDVLFAIERKTLRPILEHPAIWLLLITGLAVYFFILLAVLFSPALIVVAKRPFLDALRWSLIGGMYNLLPLLFYISLLFILWIFLMLINMAMGYLVGVIFGLMGVTFELTNPFVSILFEIIFAALIMPTVFASLYCAFNDIFCAEPSLHYKEEHLHSNINGVGEIP